MTFGEKLKISIKAKNYTQLKFADMLYISPNALNKWINGKSEPGLNDLRRICEFLNVSADWLLGVNGEE